MKQLLTGLIHEVCKIINHCEKVATKIILDNRVIIDLIVETLLDARNN